MNIVLKLPLLLIFAVSSLGLSKEIATTALSAPKTFNLDDGVVIKGYDPVSYFQSSGPLKGDKKITASHDGVSYLFATEENKTKFLGNPSAFIPQYGGWCATAVAGGYKYDIDPKHYKITDNKLYLFYKGFLGDAKKDWVKNEPQQITQADKNWPEVSQKDK